MSLNRSNISYLALAISILLFTLLFKVFTGSLFGVNEQSQKEIDKYEIEKRRNDLTIQSLTQSCINIDALGQELKHSSLSQGSPCLDAMFDEETPSDSVVLILLKSGLNYATDMQTIMLSDTTRVTWVYNEEHPACKDSFAFYFEKSGVDFLIKDIEALESFIACRCDEVGI